MEKQKLALSLLFLTILVSGCADGGEKVSGRAITVQGPSIEPRSIYAGDSVRVSMRVKNTGKVPTQILVGEKGRRIMTDYCPDFFRIQDFRAYSSLKSETAKKYDLSPNQQVQMNWELKQTGANVPLNGYSCPVKFQVPFNYSVRAYQQLQVKERNLKSEVQLASKTSQGPLSIAIQTIGSSSGAGAPVFLERDDPEALFQITNDHPENSVFRGLIKVKDLELGISEGELTKCNYNPEEENIVINQNHMSQVIRCDIEGIELGESPSIRSEITASANYTYIKNVGSRRVEVQYRGN